MDVSDLYDHEISRIGPIWQRLMSEFSSRPNSRANLDELAKRASDAFLKIGLVVEVDTSGALIVDPRTMRSGSPEITIIGRVPGSVENREGFDHELKRAEVILSRERGEDFAGQRDKPLK
jgi:hypothetical protein